MKLKKRASDGFLIILIVTAALLLSQCDLRQDIFYPLETFTDDPVFSPAGGLYNSDQSIVISSSTPDAEIRYTTDGSDPCRLSTLYTGAISVAGNNADTTIRAIAISPGIMHSKIIEKNYRIKYQTAEPVFNVPGGMHTSDQSVAITCSTPGATIYFTTDGSPPTTSSAVYSSAINVSGNGTNSTLSAFAAVTDWTDSAVTANTYNIRYVIYFVSSDRVYISENDGADWDSFDRSGLLTSIYVIGSKIYTGGTNVLHYSPDGGMNWNSKAYAGEMTDVNYFGSTVYCSNNSAGGLMYSTNNGDSWMGPTLTVDQRRIQSNGSILFLATNQGVYFSKGSAGVDLKVFSHTSSPVSSPITSAEGILSDSTSDAFPLGSDIYIASNGGVSVFHTSALPVPTVDNYTVTEGLASNQVNGISSDGTWIYAATDAGLSVYNGAAWNTMIPGVVCNRVRLVGSVVYVATEDGVYISYDQGANWSNHFSGLSVPDIQAAARP